MLQTPRLTLVPHAPEHFEEYAAFWGKDAGPFMRTLAPMRPDDAWTRLLRHHGHWAAFGYGPMLGFDADGALVAEAGFADFKRGIGGHFDGVPEGMWKIDAGVQNRGLASEAMAAIIAWFDAHRPERRTVCLIDPANAASLKVAGRLGYVPFGDAVYRDTAMTLLERTTSSS